MKILIYKIILICLVKHLLFIFPYNVLCGLIFNPAFRVYFCAVFLKGVVPRRIITHNIKEQTQYVIIILSYTLEDEHYKFVIENVENFKFSANIIEKFE